MKWKLQRVKNQKKQKIWKRKPSKNPTKKTPQTTENNKQKIANKTLKTEPENRTCCKMTKYSVWGRCPVNHYREWGCYFQSHLLVTLGPDGSSVRRLVLAGCTHPSTADPQIRDMLFKWVSLLSILCLFGFVSLNCLNAEPVLLLNSPELKEVFQKLTGLMAVQFIGAD